MAVNRKYASDGVKQSVVALVQNRKKFFSNSFRYVKYVKNIFAPNLQKGPMWYNAFLTPKIKVFYKK